MEPLKQLTNKMLYKHTYFPLLIAVASIATFDFCYEKTENEKDEKKLNNKKKL